MARGVKYGGKRKEEPKIVELVSPTGAHLVVSKSRAENLLSRAEVKFPDGVTRKYRLASEVDEDEKATGDS